MDTNRLVPILKIQDPLLWFPNIPKIMANVENPAAIRNDLGKFLSHKTTSATGKQRSKP